MLLFQDWSSEQTWFSVLWHNTHGSYWAPDKPSNCTLSLGKPTKFLICPRTLLYYLPIWWIVMLGSTSCGKSPSIFNTDSFMPCLHIVCIWARNFNKTNQLAKHSIERHSGDATASWYFPRPRTFSRVANCCDQQFPIQFATVSCSTFASLVCEPVTSTNQINWDKSSSTFKLVVASVTNEFSKGQTIDSPAKQCPVPNDDPAIESSL